HDLELDELQWVERREQTGAKRATVLTHVSQHIVDAGGHATPAPAAKKTTAKTTAKKTAKKTPAKKAPAKKKAPTKKSSAKKAATSKAAPSRSASKTRRG